MFYMLFLYFSREAAGVESFVFTIFFSGLYGYNSFQGCIELYDQILLLHYCMLHKFS